MADNRPKFGVTLYSFTNEWQLNLFNLETLAEKVAQTGLGPGVEVVGFQSFREYPDVSDEYAKDFRALLDRYGLVPTCLGANLDVGRHKGRLMSEEEKVDYIQRQINSAVKMGFPVMRIQTSAGTQILEKFLPLLEHANIHLGFELHSPHSATHPEVIEFREAFDRFQSPCLGFIPDFSASMVGIPETCWINLRSFGAPEELIEEAKAIWPTDLPAFEKFKALSETGAKYNANQKVFNMLRTITSMFGHMPVEGWRELLPYARHIHGKFYYVNEAGVEPAISYPAIMKLLKETGYNGTISAEWEGHAFTNDPIGFEMVTRWRKMNEALFAD